MIRRELLLAAFIAIVTGACDDGAPQTPVAATPSATPSASEPPPAPEPPAPVAKPLPAPKPTIHLPAEGAFEVVDLHVDTPWRVHFKGRDVSLPEGHATPELLVEGGYAAVVYPIYIPDYIHDSHPTVADADAIYDTIERLVAAHELLAPAMGDDGARLEVAPEKVGVFVAIEGAGAFAEDVTQIDRFVRRGVRLVGPVHARDNDLAGSATGKKGHGLTELGKEFCERVYAAGALVDVSHMSDASFRDLAAIAKTHGAPVVATHSNARALASHDRNLTDAQLETIAETGGVAGLNLHRTFVGSGKMSAVVAQVMHMVKVAGVDHVAVGTDFDGGNPASSVKDAAGLPKLATALKEKGLSDAAIRKIFGENALRILYWKL